MTGHDRAGLSMPLLPQTVMVWIACALAIALTTFLAASSSAQAAVSAPPECGEYGAVAASTGLSVDIETPCPGPVSSIWVNLQCPAATVPDGAGPGVGTTLGWLRIRDNRFSVSDKHSLVTTVTKADKTLTYRVAASINGRFSGGKFVGTTSFHFGPCTSAETFTDRYQGENHFGPAPKDALRWSPNASHVGWVERAPVASPGQSGRARAIW